MRFLTFLILPLWAYGGSISELQIKSNYDRFTLQVSGGRYKLEGRSVEPGPLKDLLDVFSGEIIGDCGKLPRPDLTITAIMNGKGVERRFYVGQQIVSDGKSCVAVTGEGLYFLPLHHTWFEKTSESINVAESLVLSDSNGNTLISILEKDGRWRSKDPAQFLNWEFLNRFLDSLKKYEIDSRIHLSAATGKSSFKLKIGRTRYEIYKINASLWAMKKPGAKWLIGSNHWTFWLDLERSQLMDRYNDQFTDILDAGKSTEERVQALRSIDGQWTPSISSMLGVVLSYKTAPKELVLEAVRQLRQKPSDESMGMLVKALDNHSDPEILSAVTQALRVRYPKGPHLAEDADDDEVSKARREWSAWWKTVQKSHGGE